MKTIGVDIGGTKTAIGIIDTKTGKISTKLILYAYTPKYLGYNKRDYIRPFRGMIEKLDRKGTIFPEWRITYCNNFSR